MIVSNRSSARGVARVSKRSTPPPLPAVNQPCFHDRRQRIILGLPDPQACPFCARRDVLVIVQNLSVLDAPPAYHVTCDCCGADGPEASSRRVAAALWNRLGVTRENRFYRLLCGPGEA
jgi:hypothetical protein